MSADKFFVALGVLNTFLYGKVREQQSFNEWLRSESASLSHSRFELETAYSVYKAFVVDSYDLTLSEFRVWLLDRTIFKNHV